MPAIGDLTQGYDSRGALAYLEALKQEVIEETAKAIEDELKRVAEDFGKYWVGDAYEKFSTGMKFTGSELANKLRGLKGNLNQVFTDMHDFMESQDVNMVE